MESKKEEVLRQLKVIRKAKGMSYQNIVDGTESIGMAVSMTTVRRVFADGSKASEFKYATTLKPIVRVVMGLEEEFYDEPQTLSEAKANADGLAAVVEYKAAALDHVAAERNKYKRWVKILGITSAVLAVLLIICLVILEAYLVLDFDHPEWGLFFR